MLSGGSNRNISLLQFFKRSGHGLNRPVIFQKTLPGNFFGPWNRVRRIVRFSRKYASESRIIREHSLGLFLAWNEKTGELGYQPVRQTFIRKADRIWKLTYEDGTTVETTWSHPFYIDGRGWVMAKDLKVGDRSYTSRSIESSNRVKRDTLAMVAAGNAPPEALGDTQGRVRPLRIAEIEVLKRDETVYNFEVDTDHTYFVTEADVLVHNDSYAKGVIIQHLKAIFSLDAWKRAFGSEKKKLEERVLSYKKILDESPPNFWVSLLTKDHCDGVNMKCGLPPFFPTGIVGGLASTAKSAAQMEKLRSSLAAKELSSRATSTRAGSALKADPSHRSASFISQSQLEKGKTFTFKGGDGVQRVLLQTHGELNGKKGIYEYILDPKGVITHQRFIVGGKITGFPNQNVRRWQNLKK